LDFVICHLTGCCPYPWRNIKEFWLPFLVKRRVPRRSPKKHGGFLDREGDAPVV
jgi:hypothetical protein